MMTDLAETPDPEMEQQFARAKQRADQELARFFQDLAAAVRPIITAFNDLMAQLPPPVDRPGRLCIDGHAYRRRQLARRRRKH